jgi:hypothetical protein
MLVMLFCLFLPLGDEPYIVWLTNNKVMKAKQLPACDKGRCQLELLNGEVMSLPSELVDMKKTRSYNAGLQDRHRLAEEARREIAREEAQAKAEAEAEQAKRSIVLTADDELPKYRRNSASVSERVTPLPDGAAPDAAEAPTINEFKSDDPIYVSREKITKFPNYYQIECDILANHPNGAKDVAVTLRVNYDSSPPETLTQKMSGDLAWGRPAKVAFTLNQSDEILRTSYEVVATITE